MSARQILDEIQKLNRDERKVVVRNALESMWSDGEREAIQWSEECALQSFQMMDALEAATDTRDAAR